MAFEKTSAEAAFAANLRNIRTSRGLTQADVAEHMVSQGFRWHPPTVYKVENGERQLQLGEALELARLFGERVEDMATPGDSSTRVRGSIARQAMSAEAALAGLRTQAVDLLAQASQLKLLLLDSPDVEITFPVDELARIRWLASSRLTDAAISVIDQGDDPPPLRSGMRATEVLLADAEVVHDSKA